MVILEQHQQQPQQQCLSSMSCAAAAAAINAAQHELVATLSAESASTHPPPSATGDSSGSNSHTHDRSGCYSDEESASADSRGVYTSAAVMSPQHLTNGMTDGQRPLPQSVDHQRQPDKTLETKPPNASWLQHQQRLNLRQGQLAAWAAYTDADAQLKGLDSLARTLLAGAGLGFAESAAQELASRIVRTDLLSEGFEALLGDPAVNRNLPEASCLPGLSRLLHSCLDSDATDSDSHDDSVADSDDGSSGVSEVAAPGLQEREAWFRKRAQLVTRWQWVSQQLSDVDCRLRAYTELCDRLTAKPWRFDPGDSTSRCTPAPSQLLAGGRRRVRLQPPRMSGANCAGLVRCFCAPPLPGCVLCGGWLNRVRPVVSLAPISERCQQLDSACHPALGPVADQQDIETAVSSIFRKKRSRQQRQPEQLAMKPQYLQHRRKPLPSSFDAASQASSSSSSSSAAARQSQKQQLQQEQKRQRQYPPPLKIPSLTSTAAVKRPLQQLHERPLSISDCDAAAGLNGSAESVLFVSTAVDVSPDSPPWTAQHYEPIEYREISTPSWRQVDAAPLGPTSSVSEIHVYAKLARPAPNGGSGGTSASLRLCRVQETPGMSEDLADAAYYIRHRPCEKAEHLRNWGRKMRPSPAKPCQPRVPPDSDMSVQEDGRFNPGYSQRQFPLPQDPV